MNHVSITGNITRDPETYVPNGSENTCIKFSIANNDESRKGANGEYEDVPNYFDIKYWTKNVQYWIQKLVKGAPVTVQGRIKQERWKDKDDQNRSRIVIIAEAGYNQGFGLVVHEKAIAQNQTTEGNSSEEEDDCPF